jgi:hypothetical protein
LSQNGTFLTEDSVTTVSMSNDQSGPSQLIIRRTLTITTIETWTITIGTMAEAANRPTVSNMSPDIIEQAVDQMSQGNQEDRP